MTQAEVLDVFREALLVATKLAAPILIASIVGGRIVAIFQAATQIHEQTLTFVPKILVTALLMVCLLYTSQRNRWVYCNKPEELL